MDYVPVPLALLDIGKPLPVDIWAPDGRLLLRKGQAIESEQHKELLKAHQACVTSSDDHAWRKSFERMVYKMLRDGVDPQVIAHAGLPASIAEADYIEGKEMQGGWLDLQAILQGLLYQGKVAINPLERLASIENKVLELLKIDPDEALFILFQALADSALSYCATHALLVASVCELTAEKLALAAPTGRVMLRAALVMNISLAQEQDALAQQKSPLMEVQKEEIRAHAQTSVEILQHLGVVDENQLDLVRWHREPDVSLGLPRNLEYRQILQLADRFIARMAARKTRPAMSPLGAAKSIFMSTASEHSNLGSAMTTCVGFYPPGTYVQLVNGEQAVVIERGARANTPHVATLVNPSGMPLSKYIYRDTSESQFAIRSPLNAESFKVKVNLDKVRKARHTRPTDD